MELNNVTVDIQENHQFSKEYNCLPFSCLKLDGQKTETEVKNLEKTDYIIMPLSALDHLTNFKIHHPYFFRLTSHEIGISEYCSVLEFTAPEKTVYIPSRLMDKLFIQNRIYVNSVNLPNGKKVKFKATPEFFNLPNQQVILERFLRNLNILSLGQELDILFVGKLYKCTVIELDPCSTVSIINSDLNVEFEHVEANSSKNQMTSFRKIQSATADKNDPNNTKNNNANSAPITFPNRKTPSKLALKPFSGIGQACNNSPSVRKPFSNKVHGINDSSSNDNSDPPQQKQLFQGKANKLGDGT